MDPGIASTEEIISFGPFQLYPARQLLLEGDGPVHIGSRALDILIVLARRAGEVVSKDELFARVWPDTFVEEGNLRVHIAALRRVLRDGVAGVRYIANIPGRGYSFVAPVAGRRETSPASASLRPASLPGRLARMIGRADVIPELAALLPSARFVTIVGPGGIGKTTVAVAVADSLRDRFRDGICFLDLAAVTDPALVPSALAALLEVGVRSEDPMPSLLGALTGRQVLVVLDSCEHVIDAAADLAERLIAGTTGAHVLATSREALRAEGERIHRLPALSVPPDSDGLDAAEALSYSAVQLFVERAAAGLGGFSLREEEVAVVVDLCRRLDGLALAIEIAASWVGAFGLAGLGERLSDSFQLVMRGRRTALARHQTLSAALDWSHAQLSETERCVLRRLAVFVGVFTLDSAVAVLAKSGIGATDAIDAVANLVAKSLVSAQVDTPVSLYRLFDVTRAYASAKLEENGEQERLARLHAAHFRQLLEKAQPEWETRPAVEWLGRHRHLLDNVRAATDWSFSANGDPALGVALAVAAIPLWYSLSLVSECAERVAGALRVVDERSVPETAMRLHGALAWSLMQTRGFVPETLATWQKVLDLAERCGNVDYQLRALWGLWAGLQNRSELAPALALAERFAVVAADSDEPADSLIGDRMIGYILHLMGDQARARDYLERMVARYEVPVIGARMLRFVFDQRAIAQCFLARILWLQGHPERAVALTESLVEGAVAGSDVLSLCQVLVQGACPVALFVGDLAAADRYVRLLLEQSERQALHFWHAYGLCFEAVLVVRRGNFATGLEMLGRALEELRDIQYGVLYGLFLGEYAAALGQAGRTDEAMMAIDTAIARSHSNDELWYLPELLHIKGRLVASQGGAERAQASEQLLQEALDWARRQQTPAWELRAATSLARLHLAAGSAGAARALLEPVYARFTDGLETADLTAARALLNDLN